MQIRSTSICFDSSVIIIIYIFFLFLLQHGVIPLKGWEWAETSTLHISSCSAQHWLIHRGVSAGVNPIYRDCLCDLCISFGKCFLLVCEILTQKQESVLPFTLWKNSVQKIVVVFCILSFCFTTFWLIIKQRTLCFVIFIFIDLKARHSPTQSALFLLRKCSD